MKKDCYTFWSAWRQLKYSSLVLSPQRTDFGVCGFAKGSPVPWGSLARPQDERPGRMHQRKAIDLRWIHFVRL